MKKSKLVLSIVVLVAVLIAGSLIWSGCGSKTAAKVNGKTISQTELDAMVEKEISGLPPGMFPSGKEGEARKKQLQKDALKRLIDKMVLMGEAEKLGLAISDADVDKQVNDIKSRYPSEKQFNDALAKQKWTMDELKDNIKSSMTIQRLMDKIAPMGKVTDKQAEAFYKKNKKTFYSPEQIHTRHILVKTQAEAAKVKKLLDQGKDFSALAKKYSIDPGSKKSGGDLGWTSLKSFVPEFEKTAVALQKEEISEPVKSAYGYHIIQLLDRKKDRQMVFKEVKDQIKSMLAGQNRQETLQKWLDNIKKKSTIEISDPALK